MTLLQSAAVGVGVGVPLMGALRTLMPIPASKHDNEQRRFGALMAGLVAGLCAFLAGVLG
jgi:hypothetical protein